MAEKQLNTRILLRYDSYETWIEKDPILKAGELALATVASNFNNAANGNKVAANVQSAPTVLIKVGDGTHHYSELQFTSAKAADVYDWAKAAVKPTYNATEIKNGDKTLTQEIASLNADILALQQAIGEDGSVAEQIADAIEEAIAGLDSQAAATAGEFVTKVVLTDGVVSVESDTIKINQIKGATASDKDLVGVIAELNAAIAAAQAQADAGVAAAGVADGKAVAAQGTADQAVLDAAAAQAQADKGVADAATAQAQANKGVADAAAAHAAANAAQAAADAAQEDADKGIADAEAARVIAARAEGKIDAFMDANAVKDEVVDTLKEVIDLIEAGDDVAEGLLSDMTQAKADILANGAAIEALQAKDVELGKKDEALVAEDLRLAGLIQDNADDIADNAEEIGKIKADYATKVELKATDDKAVANAAAIELLKTADNNITTRIDGVVANLNQEIADRKEAVTNVTTTITTEIARVEGLISAEEQRAMGVEAGLATDVASRVKTIDSDVGIKTVRTEDKVTVGIDDAVTFIFNCGGAGSYAE